MSEWQPIETAPDDGRILIFSTLYEDNPYMRYRIIDAQFAKILIGVTHWKQLEPPSFTKSVAVENMTLVSFKKA